jgi:hypothetical protein
VVGLVVDELPNKVMVVDPEANVVLRTHDFRGEESFDARRGRGAVFVVMGSRGAPVRLTRFTSGAPRGVTLHSLWLGIEARRAGASDLLPSRAREALEAVRGSVARAEGVPVSAVRGVAVTPGIFPSSALGCPNVLGFRVVSPGYQVVVEAAGRTHDYRAPLLKRDPFFCQHGSPPSARNLLRAPRHAHHVTAITLAVDSRASQAFVVMPEGLVAKVLLARRIVRVRRLGARLPEVHLPLHGDDVDARWSGKAGWSTRWTFPPGRARAAS